MCVNESYLFNLLDRANLDKAADSYTLTFPVRYCSRYKSIFGKRDTRYGCEVWSTRYDKVTTP